MTSDEELLEAALHGDEGAFTALFRRRQGAIYRFALHMSGEAMVSEDVTQEVFMALLESGGRFDPARGTLLSFLYGIARNLLLRRFEKKRPEDSDALALLNEPTKPVHTYNPLVQINSGSKSQLEETRA